MKNTYLQTALFLPIIFIMTSCAPSANDSQIDVTSSGVIIPSAGPDIDLFAPPADDESGNPEISRQLLHVSISEEFIPHEVANFSLDTDSTDEQVIAFKFREGQNDRIGLLVADYDPLRDGYFISWQGMTLSTSLKTFHMYTEDITGDRRPELVVIGTNNQGEQTLDIFKQQTSSSYGVQMINILSIGADIEAHITTVERSDYYNSGASNGTPYSISAFSQDLESENHLDMVQSIYTWRQAEGRFLLSRSERIPGSRVEQDQLAELYAGNLSDYHNFIDGPWLSDDGERLILFSHSSSSIQMATADRQINYRWVESSPFAFGSSIRVQMQNENISKVVQYATVAVLDLNTMIITLRNEDDIKFWSGTYTRYKINEDQSLAGEKILYPFGVSGLYRSDNNWEMFFSAPLITLRRPEEEKSGGYAIFSLNGTSVLEINFTDESSVTPEKWQFLVDFEEYVENEQLHRQLTIQEATLSSYGVVPTSDEIIVLEQVIDLEDEN